MESSIAKRLDIVGRIAKIIRLRFKGGGGCYERWSSRCAVLTGSGEITIVDAKSTKIAISRSIGCRARGSTVVVFVGRLDCECQMVDSVIRKPFWEGWEMGFAR